MKIFYFLMFKYLKNLYQNYKRFIFIYLLFICLFIFSTGEIQFGKIQLGETQQFINTPHFLKKLYATWRNVILPRFKIRRVSCLVRWRII